MKTNSRRLLAVLALVKNGGYPNVVNEALTYLLKAKGPNGTWGSTSATVLTLKALVAGMDGARGKGKSGGYRTITFYSGAIMPVYLLTVFGKGEKTNLSDAECNTLRALTKALTAEHKDAVAAWVSKKGKTR